MKQLIFVPIMCISEAFYYGFYDYLLEGFKNIKTPDCVSIIEVWGYSEILINQVFKVVKDINFDSCKNSDLTFEEPVSLMVFEIETDVSLTYQILPWLDEGIKEVIKNAETSVGLYFFYLINEGKEFHLPNIAKVFGKSKTIIMEDERYDDFSFLQSMAEYINYYLYFNDDDSIHKAFPEISAKLLLISPIA